MKKTKKKYLLVEYRDIGLGYNVPLKYLPEKRKKGSGNQSKFKADYIRIAKICCRDLGADIKQLCKIFNCSTQTLYNWMYENELFLETIKKNRDLYDLYKIERTLVARALGIEYEEVKREMIKVPEKYKGKAYIPAEKITRTKKFVPGDPSCLFFWLQNRNSKRWKNTKYLQIEGDIKTTDETAVKLDRLRKLETKDLMKLKKLYNKTKSNKRSLEL